MPAQTPEACEESFAEHLNTGSVKFIEVSPLAPGGEFTL